MSKQVKQVVGAPSIPYPFVTSVHSLPVPSICGMPVLSRAAQSCPMIPSVKPLCNTPASVDDVLPITRPHIPPPAVNPSSRAHRQRKRQSHVPNATP